MTEKVRQREQCSELQLILLFILLTVTLNMKIHFVSCILHLMLKMLGFFLMMHFVSCFEVGMPPRILLKSFVENVLVLCFIKMHIYGSQSKMLVLEKWLLQPGKVPGDFRYICMFS